MMIRNKETLSTLYLNTLNPPGQVETLDPSKPKPGRHGSLQVGSRPFYFRTTPRRYETIDVLREKSCRPENGRREGTYYSHGVGHTPLAPA